MAEKITLADFGRWTANSSGTLGLAGAVHPDDCPIGRDKCDDCSLFMGHNASAPAFVGKGIKFCCGRLLPDAESAA